MDSTRRSGGGSSLDGCVVPLSLVESGDACVVLVNMLVIARMSGPVMEIVTRVALVNAIPGVTWKVGRSCGRVECVYMSNDIVGVGEVEEAEGTVEGLAFVVCRKVGAGLSGIELRLGIEGVGMRKLGEGLGVGQLG